MMNEYGYTMELNTKISVEMIKKWNEAQYS